MLKSNLPLHTHAGQQTLQHTHEPLSHTSQLLEVHVALDGRSSVMASVLNAERTVVLTHFSGEFISASVTDFIRLRGYARQMASAGLPSLYWYRDTMYQGGMKCQKTKPHYNSAPKYMQKEQGLKQVNVFNK